MISKINDIMSSFNNLDEIIKEISYKHTKYMAIAISRARFLISNTNNMEGKLTHILSYMASLFNKDDSLNLNDEMDSFLLNVFDIFPQNYIESESLYVMPVTRKYDVPKVLDLAFALSDEERMIKKLEMDEKNRNRFSRKNVDSFVMESLGDSKSLLASSLLLHNNMITMITDNADQLSGYISN